MFYSIASALNAKHWIEHLHSNSGQIQYKHCSIREVDNSYELYVEYSYGQLDLQSNI